MKLAAFLEDGERRLGCVIDDRLVGLTALWPQAAAPTDMVALLRADPTELQALRDRVEGWSPVAGNRDRSIHLGRRGQDAQVTWLPPVARPGKVLCVGLNYPSPHASTDFKPSPYPVLFHKVATSLTGHRSPIALPHISQRVLYEGELALVIGRPAKEIRQDEALTYIAGYSIANDVGAADIELRTSQWTSGKMFDTFCPLGPVLVTADEVPNPAGLRIRTTLNGQVVQDGHTGEMIFDVPAIVSYISSLTTLEPGDLILTGSPKRAGDQPDPRLSLKAGDTISIEIDRIGTLTNPVIDEDRS